MRPPKNVPTPETVFTPEFLRTLTLADLRSIRDECGPGEKRIRERVRRAITHRKKLNARRGTQLVM